MRHWLNVTVFGLLVAAGGADVCYGQPRYVLTDLGAMGLVPYAINNRGEVVGTWVGRGVFLYDGDRLIDIGQMAPGGTAALYDVNDHGQAVGVWGCPDIIRNALYYDGSQLHDLGMMGGSRSVAYGINSHGSIVGYAGGSGENYAFLLQGDEVTTFDSLIPDWSWAWDINDAGQVVGTAGTGTEPRRAFIYDGAELVYLPGLGGKHSIASEINELGQIVGYAESPDGRDHACLWEGGSILDLGTLGGEWSRAWAINDSGVVIGYSGTAGGESPLFVYDGAAMWDVNDLALDAEGWLFEHTNGFCAINDAGQIVGRGRLNGSARGYLLTPVELVPEPSPPALLTTACFVWWMVRRGRRASGRSADGYASDS